MKSCIRNSQNFNLTRARCLEFGNDIVPPLTKNFSAAYLPDFNGYRPRR